MNKSSTKAKASKANRFEKFAKAIGIQDATLVKSNDTLAKLSVPSISQARRALVKLGLKSRKQTNKDRLVFRVPNHGLLVLRSDLRALIIRNAH